MPAGLFFAVHHDGERETQLVEDEANNDGEGRRPSGALLLALLDIGAQHGVDAPLIAGALALEPVEHVLVDADRDRAGTSPAMTNAGLPVRA